MVIRDQTGVVHESEIQICSLDLLVFAYIKEIMDEDSQGSNYLRTLIINGHKLLLNWMTSFETQIIPAVSGKAFKKAVAGQGPDVREESPELLKFLE